MNRFFWDWLVPLTLSGTLSAGLLLLLERLPARHQPTYCWRYRAVLLGLLLFIAPVRLPILSLFKAATALPVPLALALSPLSKQQAMAALQTAIPLTGGEIFGWIWLLGCLIALMTAAGTAISFHRMLRRGCRPIDDPEMLSVLERCKRECGVTREITLFHLAGIGSPALTGLFRPRILIDQSPLSPAELRFVLLHELTHYQNHDLVWRALAVMVRALQWFNPLAWLLSAKVVSLGELCCDETMTQRMPYDERYAYSKALLNLIGRAKGGSSASVCFAQGKTGLQKRLEVILEGIPARKGLLIGTMGLAITLLLGTLCSALLAPGGSIAVIGGADGPTAIFMAEKSPEEGRDSFGAPTPTALIAPVESGYLSLGFGGEVQHMGLDYICEIGTPVVAAAPGTVVWAQSGNTGYGSYVVIDHGGGLTTLYAHNSKLLVSEGDWVEQGQNIAESGRSGNATGPHCHFELRQDGVPIDPMENWN